MLIDVRREDEAHVILINTVVFAQLLAMESIYGDNVYIFERRQGLRFFQVRLLQKTLNLRANSWI